MKKLIFAAIAMLLCGAVQAQSQKSLSELDKAFKQAKSSDTIMALMGDLEQAVPATESDMVILGDFLDKYPEPARKAALKIKDQKLTKSVIRECRKRIDALNLPKEKNWDGLPQEERFKRVNGLMSVYALMAVLGNLRDKEAVPFLKQYITPEYDGVLSYNASQALGFIGDEAALDEMVEDIGRTREVDLSAFGDKAFVKIIKKLDEPGLSGEQKTALINQIKGGRSPERKKALKDLALNHKDRWVRDRCGLALLNSMIANPEEEDKGFIAKWVKETKDTETGYWAVVSIRTSHGNGMKPLGTQFIPILIDVLKTSPRESTRLEAAGMLGMFKVSESLPALEECVVTDKDSTVRGACRSAYYEIANEFPSEFNPRDVDGFYSSIKNPMVTGYYDKKSPGDPDRIRWDKLHQAMDSWKRRHNK